MQRDALATKAAIDYDQSAVEDCELMVEPSNGSGQYCRVGNGSGQRRRVDPAAAKIVSGVGCGSNRQTGRVNITELEVGRSTPQS